MQKLFTISLVALTGGALLTGCGRAIASAGGGPKSSTARLSVSPVQSSSITAPTPVTTSSPSTSPPSVSTSAPAAVPSDRSPSPTQATPAVQRITNDPYGFQFLIPATWIVQTRSARDGVVYESPNHLATVNEYGYGAYEAPPGSTNKTLVAIFLANQWRAQIPTKQHMSYFTQGTNGTWTWLAESWHTTKNIHYALVYLNPTTDLYVMFTYPKEDAAQYNTVVNMAVHSFQP